MSSQKNKSPPFIHALQPRLYILDAQSNPVAEPDPVKWLEWIATNNRTLACDLVGDVTVSTVFIGIDHNFLHDRAPPVLWETMIFDGPHSEYKQKYSSREDALAGHNKAVALAKPALH